MSREQQVQRVLAATVTTKYVRGEEVEHYTAPLIDLSLSDEKKEKLIRRILAAAEGTADNFTDTYDVLAASRPTRNKRNPEGAAAYKAQKKARKR